MFSERFDIAAPMLNPIIEEIELMPMAQMSQSEWQTIADGNYSLLIYFVK